MAKKQDKRSALLNELAGLRTRIDKEADAYPDSIKANLHAIDGRIAALADARRVEREVGGQDV